MWKEIGLVVKKIHFLLSGTKVSYLWHKKFLAYETNVSYL